MENDLITEERKRKLFAAVYALYAYAYDKNDFCLVAILNNLWNAFERANNIPALRAWALKARRVIGEIES